MVVSVETTELLQSPCKCPFVLPYLVLCSCILFGQQSIQFQHFKIKFYFGQISSMTNLNCYEMSLTKMPRVLTSLASFFIKRER